MVVTQSEPISEADKLERNAADLALRLIRVADILTEIEWDAQDTEPSLADVTHHFAENTDRLF